MDNKKNYSTIKEYLENNLYPSLKLAMDNLIEEIKKPEYYTDILSDFNQNFFALENKAKLLQKEKELLKLERGSDYSESDYEYFMRMKIVNDTKSDHEEEEELDEFDPDFDDSEMLHLAEQELNKEEEEKIQKFNPLKFLAQKLQELNLLKKNEDFDEVVINTNDNEEF
jgi:hypothetical protein